MKQEINWYQLAKLKKEKQAKTNLKKKKKMKMCALKEGSQLKKLIYFFQSGSLSV